MKAKLSDLVKPRKDKGIPSEYPNLPYVGLEHVEPQTTKLLGTSDSSAMKSAANMFKRGDVLYSRLRPYLNKVWRADRDGMCSAEFIVLPPNEMIDGEFLKFRLNAQDFVAFANMLDAGDRPRVNFDQISEFETWIPETIEEQKIVAAYIDQTLNQIDVGISAFKRVQMRHKRYRAAVLKEVCEEQGKVMALREVGEIVTGNTPPTSEPSNYGGSIPFFKPGDLNAGYELFSSKSSLSMSGAKAARMLPPMALLVTCIGATIGKSGLSRVECCTNQQINAIVIDPKVAMPEFLYWYVTSERFQEQIRSNATSTTLPLLNKSKFSDLRIVLPSLERQKYWVELLEFHAHIAKKIDQALINLLAKSQSLRSSVLKKAFDGHLSSWERK